MSEFPDDIAALYCKIRRDLAFLALLLIGPRVLGASPGTPKKRNPLMVQHLIEPTLLPSAVTSISAIYQFLFFIFFETGGRERREEA